MNGKSGKTWIIRGALLGSAVICSFIAATHQNIFLQLGCTFVFFSSITVFILKEFPQFLKKPAEEPSFRQFITIWNEAEAAFEQKQKQSAIPAQYTNERCTFCSAPLQEGARFCVMCGEATYLGHGGKPCAHCGYMMPIEGLYCPQCRSVAGEQLILPLFTLTKTMNEKRGMSHRTLSPKRLVQTNRTEDEWLVSETPLEIDDEDTLPSVTALWTTILNVPRGAKQEIK